jgi:benzylsuccinate CoA-transferase BbsF subunit
VFNTECRGHKSVALNLATGRGREIALELMARADVVAENNRGGVVETWGLDYEVVRAVKPDIIYLSSQGYGRGGPLSKAVAFGPLNGAFAGACYLWNHADAPYPAGSTLNHPDHVASRLASAVILAALYHRNRTSEGQFIDMSQAEVAAYLLGEFYLEGALTGKPAMPPGNRVPYAAPHGVYRCQGEDRWVAIAVVGEQAWKAFLTVLEHPQWSEDDRFRDLASRLANQDELDSRVTQWTGQRTAEQVAKALQEAGVSACEVQNGDDHRADLHLRERCAIVTVEHPEVGPERHIANAIRVDGVSVDSGLSSPCLGADTGSVLHSLLGLSDAEIASLTEQKVLW